MPRKNKRKSLAELFGQLPPNPKEKHKREQKQQMRTAYLMADIRDNNQCQFPGCGKRATEHHHIIFRSHGGPHTVENLVSLCFLHHHGDKFDPDRNLEWRKYWENWSKEKYPEFWRERA